jgi:hypothetical protein
MTIAATREVTSNAASARVLGLEAAIQPMSAAGVGHRAAEDDKLDGRHVTLDGRRMVNFGSCSYLGLELDPRLTEGACDAVARYGVIFSSSRAYLSAPIFPRYEEGGRAARHPRPVRSRLLRQSGDLSGRPPTARRDPGDVHGKPERRGRRPPRRLHGPVAARTRRMPAHDSNAADVCPVNLGMSQRQG